MKRIFIIAICLPPGFVLMVIAHEFGHALAAKLTLNSEPTVYLWPGISIYPKPGEPLDTPWPERSIGMTLLPDVAPKRINLIFPPASNAVSSTPTPPSLFISRYFQPLRDEKRYAVIRLMGAGSTYLLSVICLGFISVLKPTGAFRVALLAGALMYVDLVSYALVPQFLSLPHLLIAGGAEPEPLDALVALGINRWLAAALILLAGLLQTKLLYLSFG